MIRTLTTLGVAAALAVVNISVAQAQGTPNAPQLQSTGSFGLDYANFSPSSGATGNQWGLTGTYNFALNYNLGANLTLGYHSVSGSGPTLGAWNGGASLISAGNKFLDDRAVANDFGSRLRGTFGLGWANYKSTAFSQSVVNYGANFDVLLSPSALWSAKGGGFSASNGGSSGYYLGTGLTGYVVPDYAVTARVDYTRWSASPGSNQADYTLSGEYLFSRSTPVSLYGGWTYSTFPPGTFHVNQLSGGLRLYVGGVPGQSLEQRNRTGTPDPMTSIFFPLQYRF